MHESTQMLSKRTVTPALFRTQSQTHAGNGHEAPLVSINVRGVPYREVNHRIWQLVKEGVETIVLHGVTGQRYLGTNLRKEVRILMDGVPGNDLGAFMDGPQIIVLNDAQDGCGNTMNSGSIVIHGSAGDILGHSMRGGKIFVRDSVGYRVGIHMKEYGTIKPVIVIGDTAQHFLGEYMSGGILVVLGSNLGPGEVHPSHYVGTGMHGGVIYMRGPVRRSLLGKEVGVRPVDAEDMALLGGLVSEYTDHFQRDAEELLAPPSGSEWIKLLPLTKRPYGRLYAY
jgi:glutamate synthase domain-containing protein 3